MSLAQRSSAALTNWVRRGRWLKKTFPGADSRFYIQTDPPSLTQQMPQLLAGLRSFTKRRRPLLLGVSRKSFIGKLLGADVENRLPASLACATLAVAAGVNFIRTHDVAETVQAVRMAEAILSRNNHVD